MAYAPMPSDGAPMGPDFSGAGRGLGGGARPVALAVPPPAAPGGGSSVPPGPPPGLRVTPRFDGAPLHTKAARLLREIEGPRGLATRGSVWLRHGFYAGVVLGCSALTQGLMGPLPGVGDGGYWMLYSVAVMFLTAAVGAAFYTNHRNEIIEQVKHFVFGIVLFPGTGLAVLMRAMSSVTNQAANPGDFLSYTLADALPLVYFATIVIPCLIFIKAISGMRHLHRTRQDDQEALDIWTRQGILQR